MELITALIVGGTIITILSCVIVAIYLSNKELREYHREGSIEISKLQVEHEKEVQRHKKLLSQKKSSETRLGQISENLVPFLEGCPYDPKTMHFMASPIDYLVFDLDEGKIVFLEIKSGNSRASKKQKTIKNIIQSGHVYYEEMRINEKGVKSKKAINSK